jgi:SAM-dependent methyltransferase
MNNGPEKKELTDLLKTEEGRERLSSYEGQALIPVCQLLKKPSNDEEAQTAASYLAKLAKRQESRDAINRFFADRSALYGALGSELPKLRKNAARLLGALSFEKDAAALASALLSEQTRFVRPSIILALGSAGGEEAKKALQSHNIPPVSDETEAKHFAEESDALKTALSRLTPRDRHRFLGLRYETETELRSALCLAVPLSNELKEQGFRPERVSGDRVSVKTNDYPGLFKARSFSEALLPLARGIPLRAEAIASVKSRMIELLKYSHEGVPPYAYRIELKAEADRGTLARGLARILDGPELVNAPSEYEAELRIEASGPICDVYLKLFTFLDNRFIYRLQSLPASIKPSVAAGVLRYALPFLKKDARVLDPCCGSGTMLIERAMISPCKELIGLDIFGKAADISRENAGAAKIKAKFIKTDCLNFKPGGQFDEVISNLPFGNRVGTHKENTELYEGLARKLTEWLAPDGIAVLYTMEYELLKRLINKTKGLALENEAHTEAGGLLPGIFIIGGIEFIKTA